MHSEADQAGAPSPTPSPTRPVVGVVVVAYNGQDFIADCLESLSSADYEELRVVVVDNQSPDGTVDAVRDWASGAKPFDVGGDWPFQGYSPSPKPVSFEEYAADDPGRRVKADFTLIHSGANLGFAAGVNVGLRALLDEPDVKYYWILNPDTAVDPGAPAAFVRRAESMGRFAVIGGRVVYYDDPGRIQTDAGRLHPYAHTAVGVNIHKNADACAMPPVESVDYIAGVSMFASREFIDRAGLMDEGWFVYFEEIEWQLRRGDLPYGLEPEARILHRAGASIDAGGAKRSTAPFAVYFMCRNVMRFVWDQAPWKLPFAYALAYWKLVRHQGCGWPQFTALFRGLHQMGPPDCVRKKLPDAVWERILKG